MAVGTDDTPLRVRGLTCWRKHRLVLDGLDLDVARPGVVVVAGANGAGKTTLLRCLVGLQRHRGVVEVGGRAWRLGLRGPAPVAYLAQGATFPGSFTVRSALEYHSYLGAVPADRVDERVDWALDVFDLAALAGRRLGRLSGGEQRLAMVAGALLGDPLVVLLDEPSAGLDATHRDRLRRALRIVGRQAVVLVTSHAVDDLAVGPRLLYLHGAGFAYDGPAAEFVALGGTDGRPEERVVRAIASMERGG